MADIWTYVQLITSEHANKPKFVATVIERIRGYVDAQNQLESLFTLFDLDTAVGQQLDIVGQWIGLSRLITVRGVSNYFSLDVPGLGLDQAQWAPPQIIPYSSIFSLDDDDYRILLKSRVLANVWDGTKDGAYAAWNELMNPRGFQVLIQESVPRARLYFSLDVARAGLDEAPWLTPDAASQVAYDQMSMILVLMGLTAADPITWALFTGPYLELKPAGVKIEYYAAPSVPGLPVFALDAGPATGPATYPPVPLAGLDIGAWATLTPGA
jgi:hypothetical protein